MKFSKALQEKIRREGMSEKVYSHISQVGRFEHFFRYRLDWRYARSYRLHTWLKKQIDNPKIEAIAAQCVSDSYDETVQNVLKYWQAKPVGEHMKYIGDKENYGTTEYWATIDEIIEIMQDDCDGFMVAIFLTCLAAGVPEYRLYCTIGTVVGGGHAYVVYLADNGLEYAIDGCYWTRTSARMNKPYAYNPNYYGGLREWARFNTQGTFKQKI